MTHIETIKLMKSRIQMALNSYEIPMTAGVAEALTAANKAIGEGGPTEKQRSDSERTDPPSLDYDEAVRIQRASLAEQESVAIPEWPQTISIADLDYVQCKKPESWSDEHFKTWQLLQVAERNKTIMRVYARKLKQRLDEQPVTQEPAGYALNKIVSAHIADLRRCVPILMNYPELSRTAKEVEKAADELEAAIQEQKNEHR